MNENCWMCGAVAKTAEHKFKKSDIVRGHGNGPYNNDGNKLSHYCEGRESIVQGPNSKVLKYPNNLCAKCNNEKTQPFDKAYDKFISWVLQNEDSVLNNRNIDFEMVYSFGWEEAQCNLYKYLAKAFGCRIVHTKAPVPLDIIQLFDKDSFQTGLRISISVNEAMLLMEKKDRDGFVGCYDFSALPKNADRREISHAYWDSKVSWITFQYWYCMLPPEDFDAGDIWVADRKVVQLGKYMPLRW